MPSIARALPEFDHRISEDRAGNCWREVDPLLVMRWDVPALRLTGLTSCDRQKP